MVNSVGGIPDVVVGGATRVEATVPIPLGEGVSRAVIVLLMGEHETRARNSRTGVGLKRKNLLEGIMECWLGEEWGCGWE
jgi:hypothetical protein